MIASLDFDEFNLDGFYFNMTDELTANLDYAKDRFYYSSLRAFSFNWPYICYSGLDINSIIIVSVFDQQFQRILFPRDIRSQVQILKTFITETMDLLILVDLDGVGFNEIKTYQIYIIDLDKINIHTRESHLVETIIMEHLVTFTSEHVGLEDIEELFVRG